VADGVVGGDGAEGDQGCRVRRGPGLPGEHFVADGQHRDGGDVGEVEGIEVFCPDDGSLCFEGHDIGVDGHLGTG
jgi:hypothetical protein